MADGGASSLAERLLDRIAQLVQQRLPSELTQQDLSSFLARYRAPLLQVIEQGLVPLLRSTPASTPATATGLAELWSSSQRAEANLAAMNLLASGRTSFSAEDRAVLARYSGWGGIGLERYAHRFPASFPAPEARGLVHEYYTPTRVWQAVATMLAGYRHLPHNAKDGLHPYSGKPTAWHLPRNKDGQIHALEPSAGIGRALAAFAEWPLRWTALEASAVSSRLLRALYPDATVIEGYAESYLARARDRFGLILANPPYGPRGAGLELDPHGYRSKQAYLYFTIRTAERLEQNGIGVYIIPTGLMSSKAPAFVRHRTELLRRAHLMAAFRLPSTPPEGGTPADVAYDNFVVDVLVVQGRGGIATAPPASDVRVIEGGYFEDHPSHILGKPVGALVEEDAPPGPKIRRGYQVVGRFTGFPAFTPRPMVEVELGKEAAQGKARGGLTRAAITEEMGADVPERLKVAVAFGARADTLLAGMAAGQNAEALGRAELVRDVDTWLASHGNPHQDVGLRALAEQNVAAQRFLAVMDRSGRVLPELRKPSAPETYTGPKTLPELAEWLFRQKGGLPLAIADLSDAAQRAGLDGVTTARCWSELWPVGWRVDGDHIEPKDHYLTGFLWPKYDRAKASRRPEAAEQARELKERIGWIGGAALRAQSAPNQPWVPLDLVQRFAERFAEWRYGPLVHKDGLLQPKNHPYGTLENTEKGRGGFAQNALCFLGWVNQDKQLWKPAKEKRINEAGDEETVPVEEVRRKQEATWLKQWQDWLQNDDAIVDALEEAYNRTLRGYVPPVWSGDPITVARWNPAIKLHPYQNSGARKLLANRCGLLAFDVGLGKTYTGIKTLARARQEGWARRPAVVVPNTICWKWKRDFERCLPDYRVVVIGSNRKQATSGPRKGKWVAVLDTPQERGAKWTAFQAGAYDVAIVTYSALARQQIDADFVQEYVGQTVAIRRSIALSIEQADEAEKEKGEKKTPKKRTERSEADMAERVRAWVGDKLAPPKGWQYDEGIDWHQLGIDFLMVDEAQNFKNLFFSAREGSSDRAAAKRAWALDFRCASVRKHSGGAGVVLLSATPMKNAAAEFYNLLHLVNPKVWEQVGVSDPEGFISQFAHIEMKQVTQGDGKQTTQQVVTGFHHLDVLKGVVFRWAEFKNSQQVGLKLPEVRRVQHIARPTDEQMEMFKRLFAELVDIQDKIRNVARMAKGNPQSQQILNVLRLKKQGVNARLYLCAIHPGLLDGGSKRPEAGPKLVECVKAIVATRPQTCSTIADGKEWCLDCGHLVFAENIEVHNHLRTLLVAAGIPRERIAILNAQEAGDLELRQQIAEGFNGVGDPEDEVYEAPKYDVVIANAVAYEGIDLQRRTCAIHHIDVPWEPATLQQRNGRAVRQGNKFGDISLHFYFVAGSSEQHRLDKIERKRGIMLALYDEGDLKTNTVTADDLEADDDVADAFLAFAPPQIRAQLAEAAAEEKKESAALADTRARKAANAVLKEAVQAKRRLLKATGERADALQAEYAALSARIGQFASRLWDGPWHDLARRALETGEAFIPEEGLPLFVGMHLQIEGSSYIVTAMSADPERQPGLHVVDTSEATPDFAFLQNAAGVQVRSELPLADTAWFVGRWPKYAPFYGHGFYQWIGTKWYAHGAAWQAALWPAFWQAHKGDYTHLAIPLLDGGTLRLWGGGRLFQEPIPPTAEGWETFLQVIRRSRLKYSDLSATAHAWWGRPLPRGVVGADLGESE